MANLSYSQDFSSDHGFTRVPDINFPGPMGSCYTICPPVIVFIKSLFNCFLRTCSQTGLSVNLVRPCSLCTHFIPSIISCIPPSAYDLLFPRTPLSVNHSNPTVATDILVIHHCYSHKTCIGVTHHCESNGMSITSNDTLRKFGHDNNLKLNLDRSNRSFRAQLRLGISPLHMDT